MRDRLPSRCLFLLPLLLAALPLLAGCNFARALAGREKVYHIKGQYYGLDNQKTAVLVSADEYTLFRFPNALYSTCRAVSEHLQNTVPGIEVTNPKTIREFTERNPYWTAERYSDIAQKMGVTRLVIVDLTEYRTNEPGNAHLWRGVVAGSVGVVEADGEDPDDFAFSSRAEAQFPENTEVGVLDQDVETMQYGMLALFGRNVARLFHDHEVRE